MGEQVGMERNVSGCGWKYDKGRKRGREREREEERNESPVEVKDRIAEIASNA